MFKCQPQPPASSVQSDRKRNFVVLNLLFLIVVTMEQIDASVEIFSEALREAMVSFR